MQQKGLIRLFAILFGIVSVYQLSFTWFTKNEEKKAKEYAILQTENVEEQHVLEKSYLDSVSNKPIIDLGALKLSYKESKEKEINLGLDLKGGINAILQVSVRDILSRLSNGSKNPTFNQALDQATKDQKNSDKTFLSLFFSAFEDLSDGSLKLSDPSIFGNKLLREKINYKMENDEVIPVIQEEITGSINTAFQVLRSRIDKFGVTQPNIQRVGNSGRISIELPGVKNIDRVRRLLQSTAELQFWEVYTNQDIASFFFQANTVVEQVLKEESKATQKEDDGVDTVLKKQDSTANEDELKSLLGEVSDSIKVKNLFTYLSPSVPQTQASVSSIVGTAKLIDTARVNKYLSLPEVRGLLPNDKKYTKFLWDAKSFTSTITEDEEAVNVELINLFAIKSNRDNLATIEGDVIEDASQEFGQTGKPEVSMTMNSTGTRLWGKMTTENVGKFVAVVLDDYVYTAPSVNVAITTGRTSISGGDMEVEEAQDIANVLKAGKLPATAHIIQSEVVGPSLGQKSIESSINSFVLALLVVLLWMFFYYGRAGIYSDIALSINILFIFGILTAFGAVLTLPGIAGIILTIGMSVDANVIIFERIKEELAKGKGLKVAVAHGFSFKGALSAIVDANTTTMLTGVILYIFGTGPVKGFAYTLMIGILTSLFTAVFITRLFIDSRIQKGKGLNFSTVITKKWFKNLNVSFIKKRKIAYAFSTIVIAIGIYSLITNGLNYGVDFVGGRTYIVKFEKAVDPVDVASHLKESFGDSPETKTYGERSQLKITTKYKIDETGTTIDDEVQGLLFTGLKKFLPEGLTMNQFKPGYGGEKIAGIMSASKVEPTIADDIKIAAQWAIIASLLVVFLYILFRFRKWQFSTGAVIAVFHDVMLVLTVFSLFYKYLPFDMEIGQAFIAAILTVVGYSINDTVVIFDRIREFTGIHTTWNREKVFDTALSSTLGRTINTSLTTLVVLFSIFLFGGDSIKGFMFALIVGVMVGTYSSLFIASPIAYDLNKKIDKKKK